MAVAAVVLTLEVFTDGFEPTALVGAAPSVSATIGDCPFGGPSLLVLPLLLLLTVVVMAPFYELLLILNISILYL